jgi:hypothetical protein
MKEEIYNQQPPEDYQSGKNSKHCIKRRVTKINLLIIKHLGVSRKKSFDILIAHLKYINHEVVQLTLVSQDLNYTILFTCNLLQVK